MMVQPPSGYVPYWSSRLAPASATNEVRASCSVMAGMVLLPQLEVPASGRMVNSRR